MAGVDGMPRQSGSERRNRGIQQPDLALLLEQLDPRKRLDWDTLRCMLSNPFQRPELAFIHKRPLDIALRRICLEIRQVPHEEANVREREHGYPGADRQRPRAPL